MAKLSAGSIAKEARRLGFDLCRIIPIGEAPHFEFYKAWIEQGCAGEMTYLRRNLEKRHLPANLVSANQERFRSMVVLAVNYYQNGGQSADISDPTRGVIAAYARGGDYHELIRPLLYELDAFIAGQSGRTNPGKCLVDSGPVLERDWAQLARIGFTGKNCCVIHPSLGSWLLLATVLVPEPIDAATPQKLANIRMDTDQLIAGLPVEENYGSWQIPLESMAEDDTLSKMGTCGHCSRCLTACPTNAFVGPYYLEPRRCISYWTIEAKGSIPRELRPLFGNRIFGCDVCQDVCPWNRRLEDRFPTIPGLQARQGQVAPHLLEGFNQTGPYWLDDKAFALRFAKTPLLRPGRSGMLRSVCVALGNWGVSKTLPSLAMALGNPEALVRAHAAWAVGQVMRKNGGGEAGRLLDRRLEVEMDAEVIEEIHLAMG